MREKNKRKRPYKEEIYRRIPTNYLILFSIRSIVKRRERCTLEKIVGECFYLFPKVFSFERYLQWPDALKLDRQLRSLRERGFVTGNRRIPFALTKPGERIAENTKEFLNRGVITQTVIPKVFRDADINLINSLKASGVFQKFLRNKKDFSITEMEVRNLLHCTLETPLRIVKQNFIYSVNLAKEFDEKVLIEFLKLCQQTLDKK